MAVHPNDALLCDAQQGAVDKDKKGVRQAKLLAAEEAHALHAEVAGNAGMRSVMGVAGEALRVVSVGVMDDL